MFLHIVCEDSDEHCSLVGEFLFGHFYSMTVIREAFHL